MHRVEHRNAQIIREIEAHERAGKLKAAREAAMRAFMRGKPIHGVPVEMHAALFVLQRAADAVDQCAFAGAVRADQSDPLADIANVKKRAHLLLRARRRPCTRPTRPFGAITTKATSNSPNMSTFTAEEMV